MPPHLDDLFILSASGDKPNKFFNVKVGPCCNPGMKQKDVETDEKGLK